MADILFKMAFGMPEAKDDEVWIEDTMRDFGLGPQKCRVFHPKNRLITKAQREKAERDYTERKAIEELS